MTLVFALFLLCTLIQVTWWTGILSPLAFAKTKNNQFPTRLEFNGVSVIVCAHNELPNLKRLIPALTTQDHPLYEVILVDDRSQDGTNTWLQGMKKDLLNFKFLTINHVPTGINPKKHGLIKGIEAASHDLILLTDADCCPKSNQWIQSMTSEYKQGTKIILGYSGYEKVPGILNMLIRYETLLTAILYISRALSNKPYMGVGRNLSYRKSFFNQVGGLQEVMHLTGGDDDLFVNKHASGKNTRVCLSQESFTVSKPKTDWKAYFIQKKRHLSIGKYYNSYDKWVLGIFSATHIIFWSSLVSLLIASAWVYWVVAGFLIRQLVLSWIVEKSSRKLDENISVFHLPLLDFLYSILHMYTGLMALVSNKVKWH